MQKFPWILTLLTIMFLAATAHGGEMKPPPIEPIRIEDSALIDTLEQARQESLEQENGKASIASIPGYWSRTGPGVTVYTAREWYISSALTPLYYVPPQAVISTINYNFNFTLNGWGPYLKIYIALHRWDGWWLYEIPSFNYGTTSDLTPYEFEASTGLYFVYEVDALVAGAPLYQPPTINSNSVDVNFIYWN